MTVWRTALVTGASRGLGRCFAYQLAELGYHLVLVSRSQADLDEVAEHCRALSPIEVRAWAMDCAIPGASQALLERCQREQITIDVLIANAGFGACGAYDALDEHALTGMMQLNMVALAEQVRLFLPAMRSSGWGRIMLVASIAALSPGPGMALYFATKAFVYHLGLALSEELKGTDIQVTTVLPGPTATGFGERMGLAEKAYRDMAWCRLSAEAVARQAMDDLWAGRRLSVPGWINRCCYLMAHLLPKRWMGKLILKKNIKALEHGCS